MIDYIDGINRRVYLDASTVDSSINPIDIYKEMRALRKLNESLREYDVFMKAYGNVSKGGGKSTERYVVLINGTKIVPYDTSHILTIIGTIITDDGFEGVYTIDRSGLSIGTEVDINYIPPQVEIITITTGGSALTQEEHNYLMTRPNATEVANAVLDENTGCP